MPKDARTRAFPYKAKTAGKRQSPQSGTSLASIANATSCILDPTGTASGTWGGARNRADRISVNLRHRTVSDLLAAADFAQRIGLAFNRHWTVHYEQAGIPDREGAAFVQRLLTLVRKWVQRAGGELAAVWARENGDSKGGHVHILLHIPSNLTLRNRTSRWIKAAGGTSARRASKVRTIGGSLRNVEPTSERYRVNAGNVLAYLLKAADEQTAAEFALPRCGEAGPVIGKRAGWTQNIGETARTRARE
jgi:hypothetical protein